MKNNHLEGIALLHAPAPMLLVTLCEKPLEPADQRISIPVQGKVQDRVHGKAQPIVAAPDEQAARLRRFFQLDWQRWSMR